MKQRKIRLSKRLPPIDLKTPRDCEPVLGKCAYCGTLTRCKSFTKNEVNTEYHRLFTYCYLERRSEQLFIYLCATNEPGIIAKCK